MRGIYIHIPFCKSKCPYCDFYSFKADETQKDSYLTAVLSCLDKYKNIKGQYDTLYFGGGTPSFFGAERLGTIIKAINEKFELVSPEITVECNPSSVDETFFQKLASFGVNRISMGMQSAISSERKLLGRSSSAQEVKNAVEFAKKSGICNISLDLMLGVPEQTMHSLDESLDFIFGLDITHVSAYMLKIEEGTAYFNMKDSLNIADEDEVCDLYTHAVERLAENGFKQYEISNFSKPNLESRHNLKYWNDEEYLGIGPSAHMFIKKKRYFYERDFDSFIRGEKPVFDSLGADKDEYLMLRLRLNKGVSFDEFEKKFGKKLGNDILFKAKTMQRQKLMEITDEGMNLTLNGFLLSNYVIGYLLS